jgi:type IV pilus assembly protein PilB
MDPYALAFLLVLAFLATAALAGYLVLAKLRERARLREPRPPPRAAAEDGRAAEPSSATPDSRPDREWRKLGAGVPRLFELLVRDGALAAEQAQRAAAEQRRTGERVVSVVARLGFLDEGSLLAYLGRRYGIPVVDLNLAEAPAETVGLVRKEICQRYHVFPVSRTEDTLTLALSDPTGLPAIDDVQFATGLRVTPVLASDAAITAALSKHYRADYLAEIDQLFKVDQRVTADTIEVVDRSRTLDITELEQARDEAPVIRLVNLIFADAIAKRASDIHLEPGEEAFFVRYRIDGVLYDAMSPPKPMEPAILSRVKVMARMDIAERRLPQDGRITVKVSGREIDLRVSSLPTIFGESVVLRILDKSRVVLDLGQLGFEENDLELLRRAIRAPYGMILVTGPTGSGKSTTLYAAVSAINSPGINILTAEDPVEYKLQRIKQVHVREDIGLTFTTALRAFLRQDPDVILVGEMRDTETAQIAVRAALTGHLVFSTLHTNDAPSTVTRLLDMGVAPFLVSSSLLMVVAQRLCRRICTACRAPASASMAVLLEAGFKPEEAEQVRLFAGTGCAQCANTGYRGRTVIGEILEVTPRIQECIVERRPAKEVRDIAVAEGMRSLRDAGLRKVAQGITTLDELLRVTYAP